ncbi:protein phosphatase 2C-related protein [Reticulomyxa filosa]|uniref:Protein phosphatase 2C-related protein n=1 Tax=Reticulomyxa filosa TaxID=46433 RepID=X6N633_RETFI|nr:protein phosphatase 2C-related protein [Reticulomyxa filosa]|eukprot:ETO21471.1 protein phosphatase 2C-related protein [Reticulomyxa filosa]
MSSAPFFFNLASKLVQYNIYKQIIEMTQSTTPRGTKPYLLKLNWSTLQLEELTRSETKVDITGVDEHAMDLDGDIPANIDNRGRGFVSRDIRDEQEQSERRVCSKEDKKHKAIVGGNGAGNEKEVEKANKAAQFHFELFRKEYTHYLQLNTLLQLHPSEHVSVVRFRDAYEDNSNYYVVLEYLSGGMLQDYIAPLYHYYACHCYNNNNNNNNNSNMCSQNVSSEQHLSKLSPHDSNSLGSMTNAQQFERHCAVYVNQICRVVEWLHNHGIVHRDLKASNFVFRDSSRKELVLIDLADCLFIDSGHDHNNNNNNNNVATTTTTTTSTTPHADKENQSPKINENTNHNTEKNKPDATGVRCSGKCIDQIPRIPSDRIVRDFVGSMPYLAPECIRPRHGVELFATDVWLFYYYYIIILLYYYIYI